MNNFPKIWGTNNEIYNNDLCSVNILNIKKGGTCSLHTHKSKHNVFYVINGQLKIKTDKGDSVLSQGHSFTVFCGTKHQFQALEDSTVVEVMYVQYEKEDIQRESVGFIDSYV